MIGEVQWLAWCAAIALATSACSVVVLLWARHRFYRRYLAYSPKRSYLHPLQGSGVESVAVELNGLGFVVSPLTPGSVSALLEIDISCLPLGRYLDPYIEIEARGARTRQYFERGASGIRYLNVSNILSGIQPRDRVALRGRWLTWQTGWTRLYLCRESVARSDRVLVLAPHPDDAEIAAFGIYSSTQATVVTITAGEDSDRYGGDASHTQPLDSATIARLRMWDSITVPMLGNVGPERSLCLCYPDGKLAEMCAKAQSPGEQKVSDTLFAVLRSMNVSPLMPGAQRAETWTSLVADLKHLLLQTNPTVIVTPHPSLDRHPDHGYTTAAVCEALKGSGLEPPRFFLYVVHDRLTDLYPFGFSGSVVSLPPVFEVDELACEGFCSLSMSQDVQLQKSIALEAMHDLRPVVLSAASISWREVLRRLRSMLSAIIHGLGERPTSVFRRAVRANELFFVLSVEKVEEIVSRLQQSREPTHNCSEI